MGMGRSGGRSAKNRLGEGAARRATPRERDLVDAPGQAPKLDYRPGSETWIWTPRGERFLSVVAFLSLVAFSSLCAIIIASWWGII
jgi:hypothetical protein